MVNVEALKEKCAEEWRAAYTHIEESDCDIIKHSQLAQAYYYTDALEIVTGREWYYNRLNKAMQINTLNK